MNEMKQLYIALFLLMSALVMSCGNREAERIMDSAEDVMWTRPDSALTALESIDTLALKTKSQRARYSLLYTMALDRNHLTIQDLRVIKPAASYYENHGSNDDKMKMYFYLGTAQYDTGDPESAIASYIRAKEWTILCSEGSSVPRFLMSICGTIIIRRVSHIAKRLMIILLRLRTLLGCGILPDLWRAFIRTFKTGRRPTAFILFSSRNQSVIHPFMRSNY